MASPVLRYFTQVVHSTFDSLVESWFSPFDFPFSTHGKKSERCDAWRDLNPAVLLFEIFRLNH